MSYRLRISLLPTLSDGLMSTLHKENVKTAYDFVTMPTEKLAKMISSSNKEIQMMKKKLIDQFAVFPSSVLRNHELLDKHKNCFQLPFKSINDLLRGGLNEGEITEITGPPACGKTQFSTFVSGSVVVRHSKNVIYLDTYGSFDVLKMKKIIQTRIKYKKELDHLMEKVQVVRIHDFFDLIHYFEDLKLKFSQGDVFLENVGIIVLDGVSALVGPYLGINQADGHGHFSHLCRLMLSITRKQGIALLLTNTVVTNDDSDYKPALGKYWSHIPNVRLNFNEITEDETKVTVLKSNKTPPGQFAILDWTNSI